MLKFQWNALRVGDKVFIHDSTDPGMGLIAGVVSVVESARGSNDLGIRVQGDRPDPVVLRPTRLTVHLEPLDPIRSCWRCEASERRAVKPSV